VALLPVPAVLVPVLVGAIAVLEELIGPVVVVTVVFLPSVGVVVAKDPIVVACCPVVVELVFDEVIIVAGTVAVYCSAIILEIFSG